MHPARDEWFQQVQTYRRSFRDIGRLLEVWSEADEEKWSDQKLILRTGRILERVSGGGDGMGTLVRDINRHFNNVLVHLEDDIPGISPDNFRLFCYLAVGFNNDLIARLLGLRAKGLLYSRKNQLKNRIRRASSPYKDYYLILIE
jgi:hypothetical protein